MRQRVYQLCLLIATIAVLAVPLVHAPPPVIGTPVWQPSTPTSSTPVTVLVNVTASRGVHNVTLVYTTDNWKSVNVTVSASYNATSTTAKAQIPAQANGGHVEFYIVSFDTIGRRTVNNNSGAYFAYDVPSAVTTTINWAIIGAVLAAIGIFAIVLVKTNRKPSSRQPSRTY